jgi:hypothetical protein
MTLKEIADKAFHHNINYGEIKLRRKAYENDTAYVQLGYYDDIYTFIYYDANGIKTPVRGSELIADDWYIYIADDDKKEKAISDRLTKLKYKLVDTINEVLNTLES